MAARLAGPGAHARRSLVAFAGAGACFAVACLSKETYLLWLPVLVWQLWQRSEPDERAMRLAAFGAVAGAFLVLFPAVRVEGRAGARPRPRQPAGGRRMAARPALVERQRLCRRVVTTRPGAGLVPPGPLPPAGGAGGHAGGLRRPAAAAPGLRPGDPGGLRAPPRIPAGHVRGGRPPFAALAVACTLDTLVRRGADLGRRARHVAHRLGGTVRRAVLAGAVVAGVVATAVAWSGADATALSSQDNGALVQAEQWVVANVPHGDTVVVDENLWTDLVDEGWAPAKVVAFWELGTDPDVDRRYPGPAGARWTTW